MEGHQKSNIKVEWEEIEQGSYSGYLYRAKVFGGWLVRACDDVVHDKSDVGHGMDSGWDYRNSITFIPDPGWTGWK